MTSVETINLQSLNMVRDELVATIEAAAASLEQFVESGQDNGAALQDSIDGVKQIVGTLKLLQCSEACCLAEELLATAEEIAPGSEGAKFESRMEVVSNTFFVLTRYLEYIQQSEKTSPVLLIPHINALRKLRHEAAYPECHFFPIRIRVLPKLPATNAIDIADKKQFKAFVRRARHMYQIGLLGMLSEQQLANSVAMMRRALIKLWRASGNDQPLTALWWLANVALDVFVEQKMAPLETRKFLFMRLDRVVRQLEVAGVAALAATPPKGLIKELVYLIALSRSDNADALRVVKTYNVQLFNFTHQELAREHDALYGPSVHTVHSLSKVLQAELQNVMRVLENASQSAARQIDDLPAFISTINNVAEILNVVGLLSQSTVLKEKLAVVSNWTAQNGKISMEEMQDVASTLLFIESEVQNLDSAKLSSEGVGRAHSSLAQHQTVISNQLATATRIAIEECEAGILLTKRALSSFSDSNYDIGHISNISKILTSVRGVMSMLKRVRAEKVLLQSVVFVDEVLTDQNPPAALQELLETFADVIIALEYYLNSADINCNMDDTVLQVAEDGLEALGYKVST